MLADPIKLEMTPQVRPQIIHLEAPVVNVASSKSKSHKMRTIPPSPSQGMCITINIYRGIPITS